MMTMAQHFHFARGGEAGIRLEAYGGELSIGQGDAAEEVGCKDKRAVEDTKEQRTFHPLQILVDLRCHTLDLSANLLLGEVGLKLSIGNLHSHTINI